MCEILTWDRKSYLTNVILHRAVYCTGVLELTHMVVKSRHGYINVTSSYHVASQRVQELLGAFLNIRCDI